MFSNLFLISLYTAHLPAELINMKERGSEAIKTVYKTLEREDLEVGYRLWQAVGKHVKKWLKHKEWKVHSISCRDHCERR